MKRNFYAGSLFFALSFSLWFGMTMPALGAMGTDDFFVLVESGDIRDIETAIQKGQNIEQENSYGETPLFVAIRRGYSEIVRLLLRASANPGHRADKNMTVLHYALFASAKGRPLGKMLEIVNLLLLNDMSLVNVQDQRGNTPLHYFALFYSDREIRRQIQGDLKDIPRLFGVLLHAGADLSIRDKSGNTALHDSVLGGDEEPALLLLQAGADASVVNNEGVTPLWGASAMGLPRVVSALLERGANPNVRIEGMTPLHVATGVGLLRRKPSGKWESFGEMLKRIGKEETDFLKVTKLLVEAGAEVNALSDLGESETGERGTPLNVAEEGGSTMVAKYLKSVGGRNKKPWYWPF